MPSLRIALDTPEAKRRYVRRLFHTIADRYDLITRLLSYGRDRQWKQTLVTLADPKGKRALDVACGTGDIAFALASGGATVVGLDVVPRMVAIARQKPNPVTVDFLVGDMMALPVASASFDLVTTGYGLRNVPDLERSLAEIHRVLRPGGQLLALDFDRPPNVFLRRVYLGYLTVVGSTFGLLLHGDPDTYRYIAASLDRYPGSGGVRDRMRQLGFRHAGVRPLLGGLMAINYGTK